MIISLTYTMLSDIGPVLHGRAGGHGPKGNGVSTYLTHSMGARSFLEMGVFHVVGKEALWRT